MSSRTPSPQPAQCRAGCGACCIAPSITSPIPGMPNGKPAGVRCVQLSDDNLCKLFGEPSRPAVCENFNFDGEICGEHRAQALATIAWLESSTA
ncbi:MAG: YkgJ family cysteine cluster protein [Halomonas sp.]|uniref:YkgJ family cysteine cluster protein n=1 Tax=unclassified Halomonas TaxID=2609666 RepID=UPI0009905406|nr:MULTISPECIES: YkgJ family cysteine cluster protein [unclassified Halomonas]AQU82563.1 zinc/iron-chelating domain-containing protein [Halomonas sp. 'Soap Lake \